MSESVETLEERLVSLEDRVEQLSETVTLVSRGHRETLPALTQLCTTLQKRVDLVEHVITLEATLARLKDQVAQEEDRLHRIQNEIGSRRPRRERDIEG